MALSEKLLMGLLREAHQRLNADDIVVIAQGMGLKESDVLEMLRINDAEFEARLDVVDRVRFRVRCVTINHDMAGGQWYQMYMIGCDGSAWVCHREDMPMEIGDEVSVPITGDGRLLWAMVGCNMARRRPDPSKDVLSDVWGTHPAPPVADGHGGAGRRGR